MADEWYWRLDPILNTFLLWLEERGTTHAELSTFDPGTRLQLIMTWLREQSPPFHLETAIYHIETNTPDN